ncbi:hypothetical protein [Dyella telluris]|uniref:3-dehydroquinate dehydratase n=1 Tax=Dyella telluris TaxID=2763498 RepID=A0A7G8Q8N3_9GAMM|nr:hypothetical protein [Dyella telluris]QNK03141.1 hypothetical protein H8F01_08545 [Dyella telluris]
MSIVIIQGPHAQQPHAASLAGGELHPNLQQLAAAAGRTLELFRCNGLCDFVACVRSMKRRSSEFMLLDPGELGPEATAHPEAGLSDALDDIATPYVEVHEDASTELGVPPGQHHAPVATVIINGDLGSSYRIGLGIALRRLRDDDLASRAA